MKANLNRISHFKPTKNSSMIFFLKLVTQNLDGVDSVKHTENETTVVEEVFKEIRNIHSSKIDS